VSISHDSFFERRARARTQLHAQKSSPHLAQGQHRAAAEEQEQGPSTGGGGAGPEDAHAPLARSFLVARLGRGTLALEDFYRALTATPLPVHTAPPCAACAFTAHLFAAGEIITARSLSGEEERDYERDYERDSGDTEGAFAGHRHIEEGTSGELPQIREREDEAERKGEKEHPEEEKWDEGKEERAGKGGSEKLHRTAHTARRRVTAKGQNLASVAQQQGPGQTRAERIGLQPHALPNTFEEAAALLAVMEPPDFLRVPRLSTFTARPSINVDRKNFIMDKGKGNLLQYSIRRDEDLNLGWSTSTMGGEFNPQRLTLQEWASGRAQMILCKQKTEGLSTDGPRRGAKLV
jgi:hypothetical protein